MKHYLVLGLAAAALAALASATVAVVAISLTHSNLSGLAFGVVLVLFVLGGVLAVAAWVAGMVTAAGHGWWDWFVAVLLLGALAALALGMAQTRAGEFRSREARSPAS